VTPSRIPAAPDAAPAQQAMARTPAASTRRFSTGAGTPGSASRRRWQM
jgi:hypothetical protein